MPSLNPLADPERLIRSGARRSKWRAFSSLLFLALATAAPARVEAASPAENAVSKVIDDLVRIRRIDASQLDRPRLLAEGTRLALADPTLGVTVRWLTSEMWRFQYATAPIAPRPDPNATYHLPYDAKIPRIVVQAAGGWMSHQDAESYEAIDFAMPIGASVLASRRGRVLRVGDGTPVRERPPAKPDPPNLVEVLHDDGTFGQYLHLAPGIPVKPGDLVEVGAKLGEAANSGSPSGPHLHFVVLRRLSATEIGTLPVRFQVPGMGVVTTRQGAYLGSPPPPTLKLRLSLDGRPVEDGKLARLRAGKSGQLRVEAVAADGTSRDVTSDARTEYASMTLWSVDVDDKGRISARPARGFAISAPGVDLSVGAVAIFYGAAGDRDIGLGKVEMQFTP